MIHHRGTGWTISFCCVLGHRHRLRATDDQRRPVTDRRAAEKAYYRATGAHCPREERKQRRVEAETQQAEAEQRSREQRPFKEVSKQYLEWARQHRPRSISFREKALIHLDEAFGDKALSEITQADVESYQARRRDAGAAGGTCNRERSVLSHLFSKAIAWGMVQTNPVVGSERQKESGEQPRPVTPDEEARLFAVLPEHYKPFVTLALHTGLRLGELRHQAWRDTDLVAGTLHVTQPKSGKDESVPLNETARAILASLERTSPLLFPNLPKKLTDLFKRYVEKAGLPKDITFHCLRDTYISRLAPHVSTPTLMALARHRDYRTTRRYVQIDGDHLRAGVEALDKGPASGSLVAQVDGMLAEVLEKSGK